MDIFQTYHDVLVDALKQGQAEGWLPADADFTRITLEPPRDASHGDMASNAAMVLAKAAKTNPRTLAEHIVNALSAHQDIASMTIAGAGFINITLKPDRWLTCLLDVLRIGIRYGASEIGQGEAINIEYVSANPTGPLHVGHARGAIVGDVLANLLAFTGFNVTKEYYINDAGGQVATLARSVYLRYRQALGDEIGSIPEGLYPGEYLIPVGQALATRDGARWRDCPEDEWLPYFRQEAVAAMMALIKDDLHAAGITHDVFTSEKKLVDAQHVKHSVDWLIERDYVYSGVLDKPKGHDAEDWEERPQLLFKATQFGDDSDRPLAKANGEWTYFAGDIAYHKHKIDRHFTKLITVLGADHAGYVKRLAAAVHALSDNKVRFTAILCQLVNLYQNGEPFKMSKRAGTFVTVRDVIDTIGKDALRFIMLSRKNDMLFDFDLSLVQQQSKDNPLFYVQYAHARACSVLRHAASLGFATDDTALQHTDLSLLNDADEMMLIKKLADWPRQVRLAAVHFEPHRLVYFAQEVAALFHALWNKGREDAQLRFILEEQSAITLSRLALIRAMALVLAANLTVLGIQPVEEM